MDPSQYKNYILILLFIRYVSDKYAVQPDALIKVPEGGSFQDMIDLKGKPDIGSGINGVIEKLADANPRLKGVIDDVNFEDEKLLGSGQEMQDMLTKLISIFQDEKYDFTKNQAEGDDLLTGAYEYLMRHFATESGKSKGQFYTPGEVSTILPQLIEVSNAKRRDQSVYDPTCGSGSLLIKAANETKGITIYGQEKDSSTRALAVMNMWLHDYPDADIWKDNTLANPHFTKDDSSKERSDAKNKKGTTELKEFDFVLANPPFSLKSWDQGFDPSNDEFGRFDGYGVPPKKNGDYAFLLHMIKSLKPTGKAAIIMPHGVLFRGNVEADIRKAIINTHFIKGIIGLPKNLFYGTGIHACIIVLDKENAKSRKEIFMIDASKGFYKDGPKNRLRQRDMHQIVDVFTNQIEIRKFSRKVPLTEISNKKNEYNLNFPRYIDTQEDEDLQDIEAHLKGDIPNSDINDLKSYWKVYPSIKKLLFSSSTRKGYSTLTVKKSQIKPSILDHKEFKTYSKKIEEIFLNWKTKHIRLLKDIDIGIKPKKIIDKISQDLLTEFSNLDLLDKYDIYQHLMNYWEEPMQDDVYMLAQYGWNIQLNITKNEKEKITAWGSDLLPRQVVIDKYFEKENEELESLKIQLIDVNEEIQTWVNENEGEEDIFYEAKSDTGKITKKDIEKRIIVIKNDSELLDEFEVLTEYYNLKYIKEAEIKKKITDAAKELDKKLFEKYTSFTEDELKILLIEDKWMKSIHDSISNEMEKISRNLTERIKKLAERYETPLPVLSEDVKTLIKKVDDHLEKMGFKW